MEPVVRYIVEDVAEAVASYERLGFDRAGQAAEGFAVPHARRRPGPHLRRRRARR